MSVTTGYHPENPLIVQGDHTILAEVASPHYAAARQRFGWVNGSSALARAYRLSAYDAAYLDVAIRDSLPLATLDGDLRTASLAAGVSLLPRKYEQTI